jgi:hypothetical protein
MPCERYIIEKDSRRCIAVVVSEDVDTCCNAAYVLYTYDEKYELYHDTYFEETLSLRKDNPEIVVLDPVPPVDAIAKVNFRPSVLLERSRVLSALGVKHFFSRDNPHWITCHIQIDSVPARETMGGYITGMAALEDILTQLKREE